MLRSLMVLSHTGTPGVIMRIGPSGTEKWFSHGAMRVETGGR